MFNIITGEKEERKAEEHKARDEVQARQTADGAGAQVITLLTGKLLTQQSTGVPDKTGRRCHVRHDDITVIMEDEKYWETDSDELERWKCITCRQRALIFPMS